MFLNLLLLLHICGSMGTTDNIAASLCSSEACFTLHMEKVIFEDARKKCEDNGGYLFTTKNNTEKAQLQSILSHVDGKNRRWDLTFWIGLKLRKGECVTDRSSLKGFKWISGMNFDQYSNWDREPLRTCTEDRCVTIHYDVSSNSELKWTDGSCKDTAFYACKFYFKEMCKPLSLARQGKIYYTPPFAKNPLNEANSLNSLPIGTFAEVTCGDDSSSQIFTICKAMNTWTNPGPFCTSDNQSCDLKNGGCDHFCLDVKAGGVRCECKDGFELGNDQVSCEAKDYCHGSPCQYQCKTSGAGFSCVCPKGLQLDKDLIGCVDINECQMQACDDHDCVNTQGSYMCVCRVGYKMVGGKCHDIDECTESRCSQICLNSQGSFSCHCIAGFIASEDGHACIDIDECLNNVRCEYKCKNTIGGFKCLCPNNFRLHQNGLTCIEDLTIDSTAEPTGSRSISVTHGKTIESQTMSDELKNKHAYTDAPPSDNVSMHEQTLGKVTLETNAPNSKTFNSRLLVWYAIGSVVPLVLLIAVTIGIVIFRCDRSKRNIKKKNLTADSYCWVSSGLETQLERLNGSVLTNR
ncbi:complement component C1q receptor-like [Osmerus eperlanus]|uniref:complement component C1q receptor-like n=1 Tax=Osmerus eperlanus TaxID=29151 RepID=UPI002E13AB64